MEIFSRDAIIVSGGDFFNARAELFQKIRRKTVNLITHTLSQDFLLGVELKNERIQDGVFSFFQFNRLDCAGNQLVHFFAQGVNTSGGGATFCAPSGARYSRMIKKGTYAAGHGTWPSLL